MLENKVQTIEQFLGTLSPQATENEGENGREDGKDETGEENGGDTDMN